MFECLHCQKSFTNGGGLATHQPYCKLNPERVQRVIAANPATRKGSIPWNKGLTSDDPRVAKNGKSVSEALKGKPSKVVWTDEMRRAKSEWRKKLHEDHPEMHPNRKLAGNRSSMSYPEKVAYEFLKSLEIQFEHQKRIIGYYPDFVIGSLIIEIDGEHWHNSEKDALRDKRLQEAGYTIHRIKAKEHIENRIKEILSMA